MACANLPLLVNSKSPCVSISKRPTGKLPYPKPVLSSKSKTVYDDYPPLLKSHLLVYSTYNKRIFHKKESAPDT